MDEEKKVYIDANIFIYAAINRNEEGELSRKVLEKVKEGKLKAYTSALTFDEVFWKVKKERSKDDAIKISGAFLHFPNLRFIDVTYEITLLSLRIIKKYNLKPRDAIHAACCLVNNINTIITEDVDFDRVKELTRKSLRQFKA